MRIGWALAWALALGFACRPQGAVQEPATSMTAAAPTGVEVAVTVDDLPVHGPDTPGIDRATIADRFLSTFRRHHMPPVYGFVNAKRLADDPRSESILRRWVDAGNPLGNHTYAHSSLNATSVTEFVSDIEKGEQILKQLIPDQRAWMVFRYPFLMEGDTIEKRDGVRGYLRGRGYVVAEVTIDADDWAFNAPFARCIARNDAASLAKLHRTFLDAHVEELRRMRDLSQQLVHREMRQVLLLHIGAADADALDDLLTAYEGESVRWVELRTALADPIYQEDPALPVRYGAAFPYLLAKAHDVRTTAPVFARSLEADLEATCAEQAPSSAR
jgi:peptidoglycan/xylan/chitin deacetylase (PgdA/CDA1 family)